ncbi:CHAT domain-containing protein [Kitasatospora phosalacinea]|uniref:CHAT domain-containing protein n=1 Tax=Kitasatospora phosalacinea TaxID=2065 RepID=UPI00364981FE
MAERPPAGDDEDRGGNENDGDGAGGVAAAAAGIERLRRYRELLAADGPEGERLGVLGDAIGLLARGVDGMSDTDGATAAYRHNLALALQWRYDERRELPDLERAAQVLRRGLADPAAAGRYGALLRYNAGVVLRRLHRRTRERGLLVEAAGWLAPVADGTRAEHVDPLDCRYEYGRAVLALAESDPDGGAWLDPAVAVFAALVAEADPDLPQYPAYLDSLGSAHLARFERRGGRADVDAAVGFARRAVAAEHARGEDSAAALANLGAALRARGALRADGGADLDEAVRRTGEALELAGSASEWAGVLSNLSGTLLERSERTGSLEDLEHAVRLAEQAELADPDSPDLPDRLHHVALARRTRFLRLADQEDLAAALAAHDRSLAACPDDSPSRPALLSGWANTLRTRHDLAGGPADDPADLRTAVGAMDEALAAVPADSPDRAGYLNNLGALLSALGFAHGDPAAAARAEAVLTEAVDRAAPRSLERARARINLGNVLAERSVRSTAPEEARALQARARAAYGAVRAPGAAVGPETLVQLAVNQGEWAEQRRDWADAVLWFEQALTAVDDLLLTQGARQHKESWLHLGRGLSARAALAALRDGAPGTAAVLAERGRTQLLSEALGLADSALARLDAAGRPDLRLRLDAARARSYGAGGGGGGAAAQWSDGPQDGLRELRDEVRSVPGFADFLAAPDLPGIAASARGGQLLYLLPTPLGGAALLVTGDRTDGWELPELTEDAVQELVGQHFDALGLRAAEERPWTAALERAGRWLWDAVLAPSLPHLDPAVPVTVVAGGLLALLPLHAAWTDGDVPSSDASPSDTSSDDVSSSDATSGDVSFDVASSGGRRWADDLLRLRYAPGARAIAPGPGPGTDGLRRPGTVRLLSGPGLDHAPLEVAAVRAAVPVADGNGDGNGPGALAEVADVLGALRGHGVVHLNCHGSGHPDRPLESALHLADGDLTVSGLLDGRERLRADLVVLSACETAVLGTRLPDEAVSLPGALLEAGARSCAASLWPVPTLATAALMGLFYRAWSAEDGHPADALRRARRLLRESSNARLAELVPEVVRAPADAGPLARQLWARGRPFRSTEAWAGFLYVGG